MQVDRSDRNRRPVHRRRVTDRVEDAAAWAFAALALLTVLVAVTVGQAGHASAMDRSRAETASRTPIRAVLLDAATVDGPQQARARWTGADGVEVTGDVPVHESGPAGTVVQVWLDADGRVTSAPLSARVAEATGLVRGILTALSGWALLALAWNGLRRLVERRNTAAWERDWERVEPEWCGRVP
ncbi:MAG: hypothetical protein QOG20_6128 [Pseudonocardiales bacterium]|nr:hypothetical protein [Pseudonocardiales bacterium]